MPKKALKSQKLVDFWEQHYGFSYVADKMNPSDLICPKALEKLEVTEREKKKNKFLSDIGKKKKPSKKRRKSGKRKWTRKDVIANLRLVVEEDGKNYYSRQIVAKKVGISYFTIKQYTQDRVIPKPIFLNEINGGIYSEYQIKLLKKVLKKKKTKEYIAAYLFEHWEDEFYEQD